MFCPKCKAEYREGFYTCSDCNIPLVTELPEESESEFEFVEFQELITTYNPFDISLLRSLLDAEGITYYFQGEHFSYVEPLAIPVRLMVKKEQISAAAEIIRDLDLSGVAFSNSEQRDGEEEEAE